MDEPVYVNGAGGTEEDINTRRMEIFLGFC
jgi:hypothetical protein